MKDFSWEIVMLPSLECEICGDWVEGDQDYILHLKLGHDIRFSLTGYLDRAYKIKNETITLDEDEDVGGDIGSHTDLDENYLNERREKFEQTIDVILKPIKNLVECNLEGLPISSEFLSEPTPEAVWESLNSLKESVNQMTFPWEALSETTTHFQQKAKKCSKTSTNMSGDSSSNSNGRSGRSFYYCPLDNCTFRISKRQMREKEHAKHLRRHHKITQKQYDADKTAFHFKKMLAF